MLRKISKSGDDDFTEQWNEHVEFLRQLRKMRGGGTVEVTWVNGVPIILGRERPTLVGIGKANGSISPRASGAVSVWEGLFGSESDTGTDTDMFNLSASVSVSSGDWVQWQVINGQYAFVKLC